MAVANCARRHALGPNMRLMPRRIGILAVLVSKANPMSWKPEIDEIHHRRTLAEQCGGTQAVAKHHAAGKLTIRERINALLDADSFQEIGKLAGTQGYDQS